MNRKLNKVLSSTVVLSMVLAPGATWAAADTTAPVTTAASAQTTLQKTTTGDTVTVGTQPAFTDMNKAAEWAKPFIIQAKEQKLINGDPDGKFRPLDNLSRREAAAIIVNVLGLEPVKAEKFSFRDLSVNDWGSKYVEALKKEGIMQGDGKGSFFPNNKITREELAVILVEAVDGDIAGKGKDLNLKDENKVSGWAKPYVQAAMEMNLLKGDGKGSFFPKNNATRQEMAVMSVNLAKALKDAETPTPAQMVPAADKSAVKVETGAENTYKVTMTVKDAESKGVTGLKGDDFTVKLRGQSYIVGQTNTFKDFSEKGEGVYEVTFSPGFALNEKVEVTVKGVTIAKDLQVGLAEMSTYKVTTSDVPAEGITAVSQLVDTKDKTQEQINEAVAAATKDAKPLKVTLATDVKGQKGYEAVRIDKVNAGENVQLWAKDTQGNWYDINQVGWGPQAGFPLVADMPETVTEVYVLSDRVGEYPLTIKVVDVKTGNAIAQREEKLAVKAADTGSTENGTTAGNQTGSNSAGQTGTTTNNGMRTSDIQTN